MRTTNFNMQMRIPQYLVYFSFVLMTWTKFDDHVLMIMIWDYFPKSELQWKQENVTVKANNHDNTITWAVIQNVLFIYRFEWKFLFYTHACDPTISHRSYEIIWNLAGKTQPPYNIHWATVVYWSTAPITHEAFHCQSGLQ